MEKNIRYQDGIGIITLAGRLDSLAAPLFDDWFETEDKPECQSYLFVMSDLSYITSAGLRCILKVAKRTAERGGKVVSYGMNQSVRDLFKISGFSAFLTNFATEDEAVAALTA